MIKYFIKYKYLLGIILLLLITIYNFGKIYNKGINKKINYNYEEFRLKAKSEANKAIGKKINDFIVKNIETNMNSKIQNNSIKIIILLSKRGCFSCFKRELKIIDELNEIETLGLVEEEEMSFALLLKKELKISLSVNMCDNINFSELSFSDKYPQIIVLEKDVVISAFKPIPEDDEFSKEYYKNLVEMIEKNNF